MSFKYLRVALIAVSGLALAACGNTWSGVKEDTGDSMQTVGKKIDEAGGTVKDEGEELEKKAE